MLDPSVVECFCGRLQVFIALFATVVSDRGFANEKLREVFLMVPTARLELAQLSPLPPQDSVSTNFTTSAV